MIFTPNVPFVVLTHIWVATIYEVNVVTAVLVCIYIYVVLLSHILECIYPQLVYGNTTSV